MAGERVRINDRGWKRFQVRIGALGTKKLSVGVPDDAGGTDGELSMTELAAVHEFGTMDGHVPERSYLRSTLTMNQNKYVKELDDATERVLFKGKKAEDELMKLGEMVRGDIVKRIQNDELGVPLEDSTVERKGSSLPLVDTGALVGAIKAVIRGAGE